MTRSLMIAVLLATTVTAAHGQYTGGPSIAYVKAGNAPEIYLVNDDRTGLTRLYTAPRKASLTWLDLKPVGNEIAFTENWNIKIQKFFDNGLPNGAATTVAAPCTAWHPDYHPSGDGRLVFIVACAGDFGVWQYTPGSGAAELFGTISTNRVRWNRAGTHIYYDEETAFNSGLLRLKRRDMTSGTVEDLGPLTALDSFDVTRGGDRLIHGSILSVKLFDAATMTDTSQSADLCVDGADLHASPDDGHYLYRSPQASGGTYVMFHSNTCSGSPVALTGKGSWNMKDWRPDPVTP